MGAPDGGHEDKVEEDYGGDGAGDTREKDGKADVRELYPQIPSQ